MAGLWGEGVCVTGGHVSLEVAVRGLRLAPFQDPFLSPDCGSRCESSASASERLSSKPQATKQQFMLLRMWIKGNTPPLLVGVQTYTTMLEIWWFLRKLGVVLTQDPAIPILGIYPKEAPLYHRDTC